MGQSLNSRSRSRNSAHPRGGRRARPRPLHYAVLASWLAFCGVLACVFWPRQPGSPVGWVPVPGEAVVTDASLPPEAPELVRLHEAVEKLRPLHKTLGAPQPGDWLLSHPEPGQTFRQYLACRPARARGPEGRDGQGSGRRGPEGRDARHGRVKPELARREAGPGRRGERSKLYIQPLGTFTATQRRIVDLTAEYMGVYFGLPVETCEDLPLSLVPAGARRVHPIWGDRQVLTTHVLDEILGPRLPQDAAACIAFTASDLWPGEGWNFVFGQATLYRRVGVWSIYRFGDPDAGEREFAECLLRTVKLATHETGHMFSMHHCIAYQCNMNGSNSLPEADRQPAWLCPECVAKVSWATGADPVDRYRKIEAFYRGQRFELTAAFYRLSAEALAGE